MARKKAAASPASAIVVAAQPLSSVFTLSGVVFPTSVPQPVTPPVKPVLTVSDLPQEAQRVFKYERLSASMLKTFLQCRRKFHINYIIGKKSDASASFTLGTAAHYALEQANRSLQVCPRALDPTDIEVYVQCFREKAAQGIIMSSETFEIGENAVRAELQTYNISEKILGIEQEFDLMTPENVRIYGFMDKVVEVDSRTIKVVDYKTSVTPMTYDEAKHDEQLAMYDLAVSMVYPQYKNRILQLKYLRTGEEVTITRSRIEQDAFRKRIQAVDLAIKDFCAKATTLSPAGSINDFCNWCSYRHSCPEYVELISSALPELPNLGALTDKEFVDTWAKVTGMMSALDQLKDNLKIWAEQRIEQDPEMKLTDGKREIYSTCSTRKEYDLELLLKSFTLDELLGKDSGEPLVQPKVKNIGNAIKAKRDAAFKKQFDDSTLVKFNSPSFRLRKVKA